MNYTICTFQLNSYLDPQISVNKKTNARRRLADRVKPRTQWSSQKPDHNKSGDTFIMVALEAVDFTGRNLTFVESTFIGKV